MRTLLNQGMREKKKKPTSEQDRPLIRIHQSKKRGQLITDITQFDINEYCLTKPNRQAMLFSFREEKSMAERDISVELKALNLGKQIREIRLKRGLTLQNISDRTGLSKPLLSQIENDVTLPPIATLLRISKALGKHIGDFFQVTVPDQKRIAVVRQEERKEAMRRLHEETERIGYRYESLAYPMSDKRMEPFIVEIEPREEKNTPVYQHAGEEFLFVLEGEMEFRGNDQVIVLRAGDSLYFHSKIPHALRGLRGEKAKVLAVIYAPE
jgi:transcriptional regulator with XRE-family HTH domain